MGYTIVDLLVKMISIEVRICDIYREISKLSANKSPLKVVAEVLAKEEERHIEYYSSCISGLPKEEIVEIDFSIYDKVSFLLDTFKSRLDNPVVHNVNQLVGFALDLERQNLALLLDIQGRLVTKEEDTHTITYRTLSEVIKQEENHVRNMEKLHRR